MSADAVPAPRVEAADSAVDDLRAELARRQTELLTALVAGGPVPDGFDADRVGIQVLSLAAKRRESVARSSPDLVAELTEAELWPKEFTVWASTHPKPAEGGSRADAAAFAEHLRTEGRLPEAAATLLEPHTHQPTEHAHRPGLLRRLRAVLPGPRPDHTDRPRWT
ncbi:hypothetical protein [Yinghuangia seranimata]|uniref:hypothetical protein n=1 Tax=Yinghuangia seranimata TaxID=408067 RepID=UPI00248CED40|nr:hypothetical protein [Yinghuangia seranimata]MDI2125125.1 hypothetical protein [Yinghuangia seranimata]